MGNDLLARGIASQLLAGLAMLKDCIDRCPEKDWHEGHGDYPFSRVAFHALFDCDYHLSEGERELKAQPFHQANRAAFGDYEELEDRGTKGMYDRGFVQSYFEHCRGKVEAAIEGRTAAELLVPNSDVRGNMTKLERYVNTIRHLQHHAAQLGLRLQFLTGKEMDWVARGHGQ
ncbi:MAG TPA: hypothetical protein VFL04_01380 [Rectinemataceae bacterium]|nr:hypothetical protein [Rectinemataceae bacterium]